MSNRLAEETSPYLLQHADNPVEWHAWGPDALAKAKAEDKPVLLSVGYAACHWCHVMAHESFENDAIAETMNKLFVNIKVDREERPDLDAIYQNALHLLGQQGGWPLTMFLTPDGEPFWGGTYFPPEPRWGRPGFGQVLEKIAEVYRTNQQAVQESVGSLKEALEAQFSGTPGELIPVAVNDQAADRLVGAFDGVHGGIGEAPKFPNPTILEMVWRAYRRSKRQEMKNAVTLTLDRMSQGGIYDHLGGGFARYSTDARWLAPHFEKMLYDNGQLLDLLTWAWQDTRSALYETRVRETVDWVLREMIAPGGGFAATYDADSEGEEGKFYVWSAAEIDAALGPDAALFKRVYDVTPQGNWEHKTILHRNHPGGVFPAPEEAKLAGLRARLFEIRGKRVWPGWDDKVLADWNGLMIAGLANAGAAFDEPEWIDAAQRAFGFVAQTMGQGGRLKHAWRNGKLQHSATLDDYANMSRAALALYEVTGDAAYLAQAEAWMATLDLHYWDQSGGGYFFTADDAEALIIRTKSAHDNATPAGNAVAAMANARLYYLTGKDAYRQRAEAIIRAFTGEIGKNFFPLSTLFNASELLQTAQQIVIVGRRGEPETQALLRAVFTTPAMNRVLSVVAPGQALPASHTAHGKGQVDGKATAYVCVGTTCSLPITEPGALAQAL
jgi:uncharacterized protein YyaL (SSP411 family)